MKLFIFRFLITFIAIQVIPIAMSQSLGYYINSYPYLGSLPTQSGITTMVVSDDSTMGSPTPTTVYTGRATNRWAVNTLTPMQANITSLLASIAGLSWTTLNGKPTFSTVATSGSYTDLSSKPTIPAQFIATAGTNIAISGTYPNQTIAVNGTLTKAYSNTTVIPNPYQIIKTGTIASGQVIFYLTDDGTVSGTALFPNGIIDGTQNLSVNDATAAYQMAYTFTNSNKTVTIAANKLTTSNILTGILGQTQANGAVVKFSVWGY